MPTALPISIQMGALPPAVRWTPQQLGDAIAARLSLVTSGTYALFAAGSTEPASNVGPWLKDNNTWYVWSNTLGAYTPQTLAPESLGYTIGANPPDPNIYSVWIETNLAGSPLALKIYYSGAWVDVYAATLASYSTIVATSAAITAALASYSNTTAMNAAIAAAIAAIPASDTYPAQGTNSAPQTIAMDGVFAKLTLDTASINPAPAPFNTASYRYVAPAAGNYAFAVTSQFDRLDGVSADTEVNLALYKNGASSGQGDLDGTPAPNGERWSPTFGGLIALAANDYLELFVDASDGVGTNDITLTVARLSVWRVSA